MARALVLIVLAGAVAACGGSDRSAPGPPTVTPVVKGEPTLCQNTIIPSAVLSYLDQHQTKRQVSVNWNTVDCPISAHPSFTLSLPQEPLRVPAGMRPVLTFDAVPEAASGYAWQPDFSAAQAGDRGTVEVSIDQPARSLNVDLVLEPVVSQLLPTSGLRPGDYAVELFARWPGGQTGYAFRVKIEAAP